jgi:hypothetical protein
MIGDAIPVYLQSPPAQFAARWLDLTGIASSPTFDEESIV